MRADLLRARAYLRRRPDAGESELYAEWYHDSEAGPRDYPAPAAYMAASLDPARFEAGWRVARRAPGAAGAVVATRDGDERLVAPPDCAPETFGDLALRPGAALRVDRLAKGYRDGFWHVWSAGWRRDGAPARLRRFYFVMAPGAETVFAARVLAAAAGDAAWSMKFLSGRHAAGRRDRAVLYVATRERLGAGWLRDAVAAGAPLCAGRPPPLTRIVADGVGQAPDPGDGASFGQAVCRCLLDAAREPDALRDEARWLAAAVARLGALLPAGTRP